MPYLPPVVNFIYILWAAFLPANALILKLNFDHQQYYEKIIEFNGVLLNNRVCNYLAVFSIDDMRKLHKLRKFLGGETLTQTLLTQIIRWN